MENDQPKQTVFRLGESTPEESEERLRRAAELLNERIRKYGKLAPNGSA